jgi:hypothetical protein
VAAASSFGRPETGSGCGCCSEASRERGRRGGGVLCAGATDRYRAGIFYSRASRASQQRAAKVQEGGHDGRQERYLCSAEGVRLFSEYVEVSGERCRLAAGGAGSRLAEGQA